METTKYILVDYENLQDIDVKKVNDNVKMLIFVGANQKNIPVEFVQKAQHKGESIQWIRIIKSGKNAADFFITYYLGKLISQKQSEFFIYSKDKGFDPLIEFLKSQNKIVKRITNFKGIDSDEIVEEEINDDDGDTNLKKVIKILGKIGKSEDGSKRSIPSTHEALLNSIKSWIKIEDDTEIERIISCLSDKKIISEENGKIKYNGTDK